MNLNYTARSYAINDTRSEATRRQHELFQKLGTLYRTKANLRALLDINPSDHGKINLLSALDTINDMIVVAHYEMQHLPSKKNKKLTETKNK